MLVFGIVHNRCSVFQEIEYHQISKGWTKQCREGKRTLAMCCRFTQETAATAPCSTYSNTKQLNLQFFLKEKTRSHKCKLNSRLTSKPKVTIDDTILQFAKKLTYFFNCLFIGKVTHNLSSSYFSK